MRESDASNMLLAERMLAAISECPRELTPPERDRHIQAMLARLRGPSRNAKLFLQMMESIRRAREAQGTGKDRFWDGHMDAIVRMGYFEQFDEGDMLLLAGDRVALQDLARRLIAIESTSAKSIDVHALPYINCHGDLRLVAHSVGTEEMLAHTIRDDGTREFHWHVTKEGWLEASEKIMAVATGDHAGHTHLSTQSDVEVMISVGEYPEDWWTEHATPVHGSGERTSG